MSSKLTNFFGSLEKKALGTLRTVENAVVDAAKKVENAVEHAPADLFEAGEKTVASAVSGLKAAASASTERTFTTGRDGFVAVDSNGQITGGRAPGARVGSLDLPKGPLDSLLEIIGDNDGQKRPVTYSLPGGKSVQVATDTSGHGALSLGDLNGAALSQGLDPKTGGMVKVGVSTPGAEGDQANVLVLPKNYDGPIFVCDIDDTLRDTSYLDLAEGKTQSPIAGAKELLQSVADKGIPIVYLSAGPDRIHSQNEAFLKQLPPGPLLDRSDMSLMDVVPFNGIQTQRQGAYKAGVLGQLKQTYPNAQLFGLGDDKYGDAIAYTEQNATTYIHDVAPGNDNLPLDFHGTLTKDYDPAFIAKVGADLQAAVQRSASFGNAAQPVDALAALSKELDKVSGAKVTQGNTLTPFIDGQNAFPQVLNAINAAKTSITYETFEFHTGEQTADQITDALIAAAKRGVTVKVMADSIGSKDILFHHNSNLEKLMAAGIEVHKYNPIDSINDVDFHRDHRKTMVVDGSTAFVGGMNTGDQYFGGPDVPGRFHDVFARLTGPAVQQVARDFADAWTGDGGSPLPASIANPPASAPQQGGVPVRIVEHTPGDDDNIHATYLAMINNAKSQINVENSYPMTDDLVAALSAAAARGVNVRYIVGSDEGAIGEDAQKNYQKLIDAGVQIFQYPTPIHTKSLSIDGLVACVGSSNVDNVSLYRNREITAVVEDPSWVKQYDASMFDRDVVGAPDGRKSVLLPRDLNESWFTRFKDTVIADLWPDTFE
jgi:cardiolipin synthase